MKIRGTIGPISAAVLALTVLGCGENKDDSANKQIRRVEVAESPFKPADLEATIDDLVKALGKAEAADIEVTVITKPLNSGYWEPVRVGANRALGELELTGQVEAPVVAEDYTQGEAAAKQVELFQQRRMDGYHGIAIAPLDNSITDEINNAVDSDIVTVTLDSDLPDSARQLYVGTNNRQAGYTAGETLAALIPESSGTVYCLGTTEPGWVDGYERTAGAAEALEKAGYTAIMHTVGWGPSSIENDFTVLTDALENADPPVVGMVGMFSNAFRAAEVAEQFGLEPGAIKIAAFDFEPDTLKYMESGYIQATHAQRQYYMGYLLPYAMYSIKVLGFKATTGILSRHMVGEGRFDTGIDVVMADQIDEFGDFLDSLGIGG
jgi:ribose transport system substrate-binding protein